MDNSLLIRLPAELRIKIYEYAITFDRVSCRPGESSRFWPERSLSTQLALTRVCKQLRSETVQLPFTLNSLVVGQAHWGTSAAGPYQDANEVTRNIASIPAGLVSESTRLSLDLRRQTGWILKYDTPAIPAPWVSVKCFFGILMQATPTHEFLLDLTPGLEKYGTHL